LPRTRQRCNLMRSCPKPTRLALLALPDTLSVDAQGPGASIARLKHSQATHGVVFVEGTPPEPEPTRKLLERIAFIRVTHYGGFYDFKPDLAIADTAYTNLALPAHTDNTYFSEPSGLQAFHLLSHEPAPGETALEAPSGGQSLLVDGFHAAQILREQNFDAWKVLKTVNLPWHASGNKGITISPDRRYPVLENPSGGLISRIRWNNDDRGVVPFHGEHEPAEWYEAARLWQEILQRKTMEYWVQLEPGKPLSEFRQSQKLERA
jgi:trimethyllysine dioxygenase